MSAEPRKLRVTVGHRALLSAVMGTALLLLAGIGVASGEDEPLAELESAPVTRTELPGARTATSNTFELSSGALETQVFQTPVNYKDEDGHWRPIDEALEEQPNGSGFTNGANSFDLYLPERMGEGPVRLSSEGAWVTAELLGAQSAPAEIDGNLASYEGGSAGATFNLESISNGVKETIELAGPSDPRVFRFQLDASAGVTPTQTEEGGLEFRDENGELVAEVPAPFMEDSSAEPQRSTDVNFDLGPQTPAGWELTVNADSEWLEDPERVWPVRIDPTTVTATPSLDCQIYRIEKDSPTNAGICSAEGGDRPRFYRSGSSTYRYRALLKFSLSSIPTNAAVMSASLGLYHPLQGSEPLPPAVQVRAVTSSWDSTTTWLNRSKTSSLLWTQPGGDFNTEGSELQSSAMGTAAQWWTFKEGMTRLVGKWVNGGLANNGLVVKVSDETPCSEACHRGAFLFHNGAHPTASLRPKLSVVYYPAAPSTSKLVSPMEGTTTARRLKLQAAWSPTTAGVTGVRFQYRVGKSGNFETIPTNLVLDGDGNPVTEWPVAVTEGTETEPLYFDAAHAPNPPGENGSGPTNLLQQQGGSIQVRAIFDGPIGVEGYSAPVEAEVNRKIGGASDMTAPIGPGTLDLLTGNLTISRTDVALSGFGGGLSFSRTYNTREPGSVGEKSLLGQGWTSGMPMEEAGGSEWRSIRLESFNETIEGETFSFAYATLTNLDGYKVAFEKEGATYIAPPEMEGNALVAQGTNQLVLAEPNGTRTTFESNGGNEYLPVSVTEGNGDSTRLVYQIVEGKRRLHMIIAPPATFILGGEGCTANNATTEPGCRALTFTYASGATWDGPRLSKITYHAPGNGGPWDVAEYGYDSTGRLIEFWDPRIAPNLKETYTYESGKLRKVTPPGQEPWTLEYTPSIDGETGISRLRQVSRPTLLSSPSTAKTSIRYGVPISGSGAPYDLSRSAVSQWGQTDVPVDATAIFPPNEVPAEPATSYQKATIYYMDAEGFAVNTATPAGAGTSSPSITTEETDEYGNVVRQLTAQNRLRALAAGGESVSRSHQLDTKSTFSPDGIELQEERGPLHPVRLESGELVQARFHRTVQYDECLPAECGPWSDTNPKPHLPTRETTGASIPGKGIDADQRITEYRYDWTLRRRTETVVDPGGLNIRSVLVYHATLGRPIEVRQPSEPSGGGAGSTRTVYYTSYNGSGDSDCTGHREWAGLPCKILPAGQPEAPDQPKLLVTKFTAYNHLGQPTEVVQSPGGGPENARKFLMTYDSAGRQTSREIEGGGNAVPKVQALYGATNGLPTVMKFVCPVAEPGCDTEEVTTTYDALGRITAYEDADGNKATTTYDSFGRPVTLNDGKGTQTFRYDAVTGLPVELEDSAAGIFTASYDADGRVLKRGLPNGLTAEATYDETGAATGLTYTKASNCGASCTWLDFDVERSISGQILRESSNLGLDTYVYDKAGRLLAAEETPQAGTCTTRLYAHDKNSNRTSMTTYGPGLTGTCATEGGTTQSYNYDAADRLLSSGMTYDNFGRITNLPGAYAGGKSLETTYFANDVVATQSQDGVTNSFQLDAALRQRQRLQANGLEGAEIFHYADSSDAPAWTQRGSVWARNIMGVGGELAAIQESGKEVELQLTNLHGDVVAAAALNPAVTSLKSTFNFDAFGNPLSGTPGRFGWMGGVQRRTELPSGVIQMGARSYVPAIGRFLSTDPIRGGSANAYDYANADPVNQVDPSGMKPHDNDCDVGIAPGVCQVWLHIKMWSRKRGRMGVRMIYKSNRWGGISRIAFDITYWRDEAGDVYREGFVKMPPPRYLNSYPGPPASCRGTDPCANNHDGRGTFRCWPGDEYQIQIIFKYNYNIGDEVETPQILQVKAQEYCSY